MSRRANRRFSLGKLLVIYLPGLHRAFFWRVSWGWGQMNMFSPLPLLRWLRFSLGASSAIRICLLVTLFFPQVASAAVYTWNFSNRLSGVFYSPTTACQAYVADRPASEKARFESVSPFSERERICNYSYEVRTDYRQSTTVKIIRYGDSCPAGQNYNADTGECETPPPPCEVGDPGIFASGDGPVINSGGRNYVVNPPMGDSVCYNKCRFTVSSHASSCFTIPGDTTRGFCNYTGTGNGESCSEPDASLGKTGGALNPPATPDVPPSDPNDPGCPDGYSWSGTTCVKTPTDGGGDGDGGSDGGGSDGGDTGGGTGGGSDGGGTGGGSDGGGTGGGTGGGGTGGGGTGDGDGDGSGGGGGSGDGEGEEGESTVGGEACDATLACSGDAIQCAILRQEKAQRCNAEKAADYEAQKSNIDALVQGEKFKLDEREVEVPSVISGASGFLPKTCPPPSQISLSSNGGHTFQLSYEPICALAADLSWLIVAAAGVAAALYIGRSVGGA